MHLSGASRGTVDILHVEGLFLEETICQNFMKLRTILQKRWVRHLVKQFKCNIDYKERFIIWTKLRHKKHINI